jgi:TolB-like protein/Tfp pilus assembly protein PilF
VASDKPGFFEELKRRHVARVAIAYAVAGWLLVQVATQVFPFFNVPNWAVRLVVILLVIGFPLAVAFAWIYELTPEGIRRTESADSPGARSEHASRQIGRKLNTLIIAVLVAAVALMGWRLLVLRHASNAASLAANAASSPDGAQRNPGTTSHATPDFAAGAAASGLQPVAQTIPEKSVAVLPFVNDSGQKNEQFFSDGLSQDLITALSQFAGLKVINRDSAFQFRDSKDSIKTIAQQLGVAHILEGSVQRAEGEVRITATLVNAADGSILWSQRYDKPYKDLFALQDAITQSVADALKAKLLTASGVVVQSDRPPSGNLDAYTAYLRGITDYARADEAGVHQAIVAYQQAVAIDPGYAAAWAALSRAWARLGGAFLGGTAQQQAFTQARRAGEKALQLAPDLAAAHTARSYFAYFESDWNEAQSEIQRALQLAPNDGDAKYLYGSVLATLGQCRRAAGLVQQALVTNPRQGGWYYALSQYLACDGRMTDAQQAIDTAIALQPQATANHEWLATLAILRGDAKAALTAAQQEPPGPWYAIAMALALQIGPDRAAADAALKNLIAKYADTGPYQIAEVYSLRRDPDAMFQWLEHAWKARDPGISQLLYDPLILRYRDDPRFAAFCKKVGLPTTTDAVAMK